MNEGVVEELVIRRSDPDDSEVIEEWLSNQLYRESCGRLFGLTASAASLIETSYLAVTALDADGHVVAFAAFNDSPPGLKSNDNLHENLWEEWLAEARGVDDELSALNSLWLSYFHVNFTDASLQAGVLARLFQSAYSSIPTTKSVLLLVRGEARLEDAELVGFNAVKSKFKEMELYRREILSQVRGLHFDSQFWSSERGEVIPHLEVRPARQEDHDNLATVFNSQSEVVTSTYGEFFIAELIAAQNEVSRALVAQVHDKAVGLLSVSSDIDTSVLWQCFELDPYDNLLEPNYMDVVREKREVIREKRRIQAEEQARLEAQRMKEETMVCNIIAQRMELQEYLKERKEAMLTQITSIMTNREQYSTMDLRSIQNLINDWLQDFEITQPSDYFNEHKSDDPGLVCNILTEQEFFLSVLQIFGLPEGYMSGEGHFHDWYRRKEEEDKQARARKGAVLASYKRTAAKNVKKGAQEPVKPPEPPTHFDLEPLKDSLTAFLKADSEARTTLRKEFVNNRDKLVRMFRGDSQELEVDTFSVNTTNFNTHLVNAELVLDPELGQVSGPLLRCFGLLRTRDKTIITNPQAPAEEEKRARPGRRKNAQEKDAQIQLQATIESGVVVEFQKDRDGNLLPATATLMKTSFNEVLKSLSLIEDFDSTLVKLGIVRNPSLLESINALGPEVTEPLPELVIPSGSNQVDYYVAVKDLDDLEAIPEPPERAKNAFGLILYCMEDAFEPFGMEFLESAFEQFPERDYMVITQPHTVSENSLQRYFVQVPPKPNNTFNHTLYIMHRDCLLIKHLRVRRTQPKDMELLADLIDSRDDAKDLNSLARQAFEDSPYIAFTIWVYDDAVGLLLLSRDVNLEYYRSHFHIEDFLSLAEHSRNSHTRLMNFLINPIFLKAQRQILREVLRLTAKTCLFFEVHNLTVIPDVFHELLHVRSRRFPHFLLRNWDHEKDPQPHEDSLYRQDGAERDFQDEKQAEFSLCFISKRLVSEQKQVNNTRILVVGASDTGLSLVETLLSLRFLRFTSITLVAPGGLRQLIEAEESLCASSCTHSQLELKQLMLENRVAVIDAMMVDLDRDQKKVFLNDDTYLVYDYLVLCLGLQDCTLAKHEYASRGMQPGEKKKTAEGIYSLNDPYLYQHWKMEGRLLKILNDRKKPSDVVVYGHTLDIFCAVQGLINRNVAPKRIVVLLNDPRFEPEESTNPLHGGDEMILNNHLAFENDPKVTERILQQITEMGVKVYKSCVLTDINVDDKGWLAGITCFVDKGRRNFSCKALLTAGKLEVDLDHFNILFESGLVFNGRLIVSQRFQTTDPFVFAAGSICEFSHQYRSQALERSLRMDRYNGREVGLRAAQSLLASVDGDAYEQLFGELVETLPTFYMPRGKGGLLPGHQHYYHIEEPHYALPAQFRGNAVNRSPIVSDSLDRPDSPGHYMRFAFSNHGLVSSVTYLSKEPVEVRSLWNCVGLAETYLNQLSSRFHSGIIPDIAEFLTENWGIALYHDWFADFTLRLKTQVKAQLSDVMLHVSSIIASGKELTREEFEKVKSMLPGGVRELIQAEALGYLASNRNHLPMYYIPG